MEEEKKIFDLNQQHCNKKDTYDFNEEDLPPYINATVFRELGIKLISHDFLDVFGFFKNQDDDQIRKQIEFVTQNQLNLPSFLDDIYSHHQAQIETKAACPQTRLKLYDECLKSYDRLHNLLTKRQLSPVIINDIYETGWEALFDLKYSCIRQWYDLKDYQKSLLDLAPNLILKTKTLIFDHTTLNLINHPRYSLEDIYWAHVGNGHILRSDLGYQYLETLDFEKDVQTMR